MMLTKTLRSVKIICENLIVNWLRSLTIHGGLLFASQFITTLTPAI